MSAFLKLRIRTLKWVMDLSWLNYLGLIGERLIVLSLLRGWKNAEEPLEQTNSPHDTTSSYDISCPWGGMETETDRGRERQRDGVQTDCVFLSLYVRQISPHGISNMSKTLTQIPHSPQLLYKCLHSIKTFARYPNLHKSQNINSWGRITSPAYHRTN